MSYIYSVLSLYDDSKDFKKAITLMIPILSVEKISLILMIYFFIIVDKLLHFLEKNDEI